MLRHWLTCRQLNSCLCFNVGFSLVACVQYSRLRYITYSAGFGEAISWSSSSTMSFSKIVFSIDPKPRRRRVWFDYNGFQLTKVLCILNYLFANYLITFSIKFRENQYKNHEKFGMNRKIFETLNLK